jgi:hypothetical protein
MWYTDLLVWVMVSIILIETHTLIVSDKKCKDTTRWLLVIILASIIILQRWQYYDLSQKANNVADAAKDLVKIVREQIK